jgi:hypothetical protein
MTDTIRPYTMQEWRDLHGGVDSPGVTPGERRLTATVEALARAEARVHEQVLFAAQSTADSKEREAAAYAHAADLRAERDAACAKLTEWQLALHAELPEMHHNANSPDSLQPKDIQAAIAELLSEMRANISDLQIDRDDARDMLRRIATCAGQRQNESVYDAVRRVVTGINMTR